MDLTGRVFLGGQTTPILVGSTSLLVQGALSRLTDSTSSLERGHVTIANQPENSHSWLKDKDLI